VSVHTLRQVRQDAEVIETVTKRGAATISTTIYREHERRVVAAIRWRDDMQHEGAVVRVA
jgi:hypothetical protein